MDLTAFPYLADHQNHLETFLEVRFVCPTPRHADEIGLGVSYYKAPWGIPGRTGWTLLLDVAHHVIKKEQRRGQSPCHSPRASMAPSLHPHKKETKQLTPDTYC